jgi:hypothetical protein
MKIPVKYIIFEKEFSGEYYNYVRMMIKIKYKLPNKVLYNVINHELVDNFHLFKDEINEALDELHISCPTFNLSSLNYVDRLEVMSKFLEKIKVENFIKKEVLKDMEEKNYQLQKENKEKRLFNSIVTKGWKTIEIEVEEND